MRSEPMKDFLAKNPNFQMAILGLLPMYHMYGQVVLIFGLMRGYKVVTMPRFIPDKFLAAIEKHKVGNSVFVWGGVGVENANEVRRQCISCLRNMFSETETNLTSLL